MLSTDSGELQSDAHSFRIRVPLAQGCERREVLAEPSGVPTGLSRGAQRGKMRHWVTYFV